MSQTMQTSAQPQANPPKTKENVQHPYNVGPTSKTLGRRCTYVTRMSCVRWERPTAHPGRHEFANKHIYPAETRRRDKACPYPLSPHDALKHHFKYL